MHITKIELEDIKSHAHFTHEFQRGTTAITGENGAGKTTLIEAIAWTLFDLLEYKKDDFVRRGAKKGVVRVTFESSLDGREYVVYRDTTNGYNVYDPSLKMRIADKKEEVTRELWKHLGVEAGTDLKSLFQCAIGVPQGTFTSDFLLTPEKRKPVFDKLLRVEDYRKSSEKLRDTVRFIEQKITDVKIRIGRAEGELARFETVEEELKNFTTQTEELSKILEAIEKEVAEKSATVKKFDEIEREVNELKIVFERLDNEKSRAEYISAQKENEQKLANAAAEKIKVVENDYQTHLKALGMLKELERERDEREKIQQAITKVETAQVNVKADQKRFQEDLKKSQNAHLEIEKLKPQVKAQEEFEGNMENLRKELGKSEAIEDSIKSLTAKMNDLRQKLIANREEIKETEAKTKEVQDTEGLQKRDSELTQNLAKFRAKLEADERFQSEIKNGLCPILSEKCLNLKSGQTLESFITTQFSEVKVQITSLETEQKQLAVSLRISREAEKFLAKLETLQKRAKEIETEGVSYKDEKSELEKQIENLPKLKNDLAEIEAKIRALDNPKAKLISFESEAKREIERREKLTETEKNLERLENDLQIEVQKLESYKDLDTNWRRFSDERDKTANAHREFLTNESLAKLAPEREKEFEKAKAELEKIGKDLAKAEKDFLSASKDYDRERHQTEKVALLEAEKRQTETRTNLANTKRRADESQNELNRLAEIRKAMQTEFQEKERLEKVAEATVFIRETLKKSAPLVARNYIYYVSLEANQMFREISGNAERTLKWTEDYGIVLEENGYERPFVNLSGGEQMAAALSVRLALLKQLSDVRLAFFDEPTTNMDAARRERLAEQISHITEKQTFDQLFIISHDDTFHGYCDNELIISANENV
ncbi:SMC family ATPase [soil metagenome]